MASGGEKKHHRKNNRKGRQPGGRAGSAAEYQRLFISLAQPSDKTSLEQPHAYPYMPTVTVYTAATSIRSPK
jgi:hypothetical protein